MKIFFYPRLALVGIRKNRKLYLPYVFSCIGMVMMYYIIQSLSDSPLLQEIHGGSTLSGILSFGRFIVAIFALIFLFYTHSFIVRRRYKEFGLYNILGMGKCGIMRVMLFESLTVSAIGLLGGIGLGVALSKLAELGLLNVIGAPVNYRYTVSLHTIGMTAGVFAAIFSLLTVRSVLRVRKCRPLELLKSETAGEKPPKANWIWAILGLLLLGTAYGIAVTIKSPLTALTLFFVAVVLVILATYLLFMSGSVALCKLLQKSKKYYYKKQHFVSVSSMAFRMKRNGAGLASICILATMVLVMISSTASLYFGKNDALDSRFPRESEVSVTFADLTDFTGAKIGRIQKTLEDVFNRNHFTPKNKTDYRYVSIAGLLTENGIDPNATDEFALDFGDVYQTYFVTLDDYNRLLDTDYTLGENEVLLKSLRCDYKQDELKIAGLCLKIAGQVDRFVELGDANTLLFPTLLAVVPDFHVLKPLEKLTDSAGQYMLSCRYYYGYDGGSDSQMIDLMQDGQTALDESLKDRNERYDYSYTCVAAEKDDFYSTFGGLFFIGILLSALFIFAAAMIIYYKQVSEGYEDQMRFAIMQKVGMTRRDIKKSINSQILTVFFAPLGFAGIHLAFAFPMVWKLLQLFNLHNCGLVIGVTAVGFLGFSLFYALIYKITARAYYMLISEK